MSSLKLTNRGFTLTELLVTIAIAAILLAVTAPSLRNIVLSNRIQGAAAEFQSALSIARAEAIKRGVDARVTVVANSKSGTPLTPNWASGVTVFYDTTSNANGDAPPTDASKLIMKTGALPADVSASVNFNHIIYNGMGRTINSAGTPLGGTVAFGASDVDWRCTIISLTGRIRSTKVSSAAYNATQCTAS